MNRSTAYRVSGVFHPLFLNAAGFALLFLIAPSLHRYTSQAMWLVIGLFTLSTVVLPLLAISLLKLNGAVNGLELETQQERKMPLLITSLLYVSVYYLFQKLQLDFVLLRYALAASSVLIFVSLTNNFYKISLHAAGVGALLGFLVKVAPFSMLDIRPLFALMCVAGGWVIAARLFAGAHSVAQIIWGLTGGFLLMWLVF